MKTKIFTLIILFSTTILFAQQDQKAKDILEQVSKKTQAFSSISANFLFSMENIQEDIKESNKGSINLKGEKYKVDLPDVGLHVYCDGETIWNYMEDGNQVTITNVDEESQELLDPSTIFEIYKKGFNYKYVKEETSKGKTLYIIDLIPESDEEDFSKVTIGIDKAKMMIHSATTYGKDGNMYGVEITKMDTNQPMDDKQFSFNTASYPDIEVIDFR